MRRIILALVTGTAVVVAVHLVILNLLSATTFPNWLVDDTEQLLSPADADRLAEFHRYLLKDHDIDYRLVTVRTPLTLERYAWERFRDSGVGQESSTGRGLLLVVDPEQDRVRLEVSRALESVYTDAFVAYLEQRQMSPFFANGRIADGMIATTELIVARAQDATAASAWDDEATTRSQGGGASADARIADGPAPKSRRGLGRDVSDDPPGVLRQYLRAMAERNDDPDLPIYSSGSRRLLHGWVVTPAQMDSQVASSRRCNRHPSHLSVRAERAVIRYPIPARQCQPWFFVHENNAWRLDLTVMQTLIRFGRDNSWYFAKDGLAGSAYGFAFADWAIDRFGYPRQVDKLEQAAR